MQVFGLPRHVARGAGLASRLTAAKVPAPRPAKAGGAEGNRTPDLDIANVALSQLSYGPKRRAFARGVAGGAGIMVRAPNAVKACGEVL